METRSIVALVVLLLALACSAPAQEQDVLFLAKKDSGTLIGQPTFEFIATEMVFGGNVVKGKPYSADGSTEFSQMLADGNRISRKTASAIARDSEGRTRREQTMAMIGPLKSSGPPPQTIIIEDPAAGVNYILEPQNKVARKIPRPADPKPAAVGGSLREEMKKEVRIEARGGGAENVLTGGPLPGGLMYSAVSTRGPGRSEQLGKQTIEGLECDGTRTVTTIPAGEIGNEQPIEIVFERWYSPRLDTVVMTRHTDPRVGETVYRLTNIQLSEPPPSLFEVPADYRVEEGPLVRHRDAK